MEQEIENEILSEHLDGVEKTTNEQKALSEKDDEPKSEDSKFFDQLCQMEWQENFIPFKKIGFKDVPDGSTEHNLSLADPLNPRVNTLSPYISLGTCEGGDFAAVVVYPYGQTPSTKEKFCKKTHIVPPPFMQCQAFLGPFGDIGTTTKIKGVDKTKTHKNASHRVYHTGASFTDQSINDANLDTDIFQEYLEFMENYAKYHCAVILARKVEAEKKAADDEEKKASVKGASSSKASKKEPIKVYGHDGKLLPDVFCGRSTDSYEFRLNEMIEQQKADDKISNRFPKDDPKARHNFAYTHSCVFPAKPIYDMKQLAIKKSAQFKIEQQLDNASIKLVKELEKSNPKLEYSPLKFYIHDKDTNLFPEAGIITPLKEEIITIPFTLEAKFEKSPVYQFNRYFNSVYIFFTSTKCKLPTLGGGSMIKGKTKLIYPPGVEPIDLSGLKRRRLEAPPEIPMIEHPDYSSNGACEPSQPQSTSSSGQHDPVATETEKGSDQSFHPLEGLGDGEENFDFVE